MEDKSKLPPDVEAAAREAGRDAVETMQMLNLLRAEEGDCVTLLSDNPDFNGQPNCAIECNGFWTNWKDRRFTGETLSGALRNAVNVYKGVDP